MADKPEQIIETAPDPEEDDLSDLDDVLDEFNPKPILPSSPKPTASGPGRPAAAPPNPATATTTKSAPEVALEDAAPAASEEDFAAQLQAGMSNLISELGENPEMQKQFEAMMAELMNAGAAGTDAQAAEHVKRASESMPKEAESGSSRGVAGTGTSKKEDRFQDSIRKTMERMQQSDTAASTSATAAKSEEEMLMEMLKSLGGGEGGLDEGGEEDFNSMLLNMMTQLTNKEILYEPMKELHDKFPAWMEKNAAGTKGEDLARYREQQQLVEEIVARFERKGYSDDNEEDREYIVERMQKMQAAGSPPPDLVGDMSAAQEALGDLDAGCPTQ